MKRILLLLLILPICCFSQLWKDYEKEAKKHKKYYIECVNQYLVKYSEVLEIENWDLKSIKIEVNPEEYCMHLLDIDPDNISKDSLVIVKNELWNESVYDVEVSVVLKSGKIDRLGFFLAPCGFLTVSGSEYQIKLRE